jgi:hypothetical protein
MNITFFQILPYLIAFLILIILFTTFIYYQTSVRKELQLIEPNGGEILRAGQTYTITWKAKKIDKVDIVLIKEGEEPKKSKIIVKNFPAKEKKYKWQIFAFEETSDRYKISIFESPWQEGNKIDYSDNYFSIIGPKFLSCEQLAIKGNWLFIPSDYPNLKRVFITRDSYNGNLGGLDGADKICQEEAKRMGLNGNWKAFLGDDNVSAIERLNLDGIFVFASAEEGLPQDKIPAYFWESFKNYLEKYAAGNENLKKSLISAHETLTKPFSKFYEKWNVLQENKGCLRFLGENFQQFYKKFFSPYLVIKDSPEEQFLKSFFGQEIWLGRVFPEDRRNCITISSLEEKISPSLVSFTLTCQNWTTNESKIKTETKENLPRCYIGPGAGVEAMGIGGMAKMVEEKEGKNIVEIGGKNCYESLKLLCIEQ